MARYCNGSTGHLSCTGDISIGGSAGPWTVAFWYKRDGSQNSRYVFSFSDGGGSSQFSIIYGYVANSFELFPNGRTGSQISITDDDWHHIAYRKDNSGTSNLDYFKDGIRTNISTSSSFTNVSSTTAPNICILHIVNMAQSTASILDLVVVPYSLPDQMITALSRGTDFGRFSSMYPKGNYWPCKDSYGQERDLKGDRHMTVNAQRAFSNEPIIPYRQRIKLRSSTPVVPPQPPQYPMFQ